MNRTSENAITIRRAGPDDIDLLLRWRKAMFLDMGKPDDARTAESLEQFALWLPEHLDDRESCAAFLALADGAPAACAIVWIHEWYPGIGDTSTRRGYIFNVYTLPQYRGRGHAGSLVDACVEWCREQGIRTVGLHASAQGQSVYARRGFRSPNMPEMVLKISAGD